MYVLYLKVYSFIKKNILKCFFFGQLKFLDNSNYFTVNVLLCFRVEIEITKHLSALSIQNYI